MPTTVTDPCDTTRPSTRPHVERLSERLALAVPPLRQALAALLEAEVHLEATYDDLGHLLSEWQTGVGVLLDDEHGERCRIIRAMPAASEVEELLARVAGFVGHQDVRGYVVAEVISGEAWEAFEAAKVAAP